MKFKKECIVCGKVVNSNDDEVICHCGFGMFPKYDLDLLREAGWVNKNIVHK